MSVSDFGKAFENKMGQLLKKHAFAVTSKDANLDQRQPWSKFYEGCDTKILIPYNSDAYISLTLVQNQIYVRISRIKSRLLRIISATPLWWFGFYPPV